PSAAASCTASATRSAASRAASATWSAASAAASPTSPPAWAPRSRTSPAVSARLSAPSPPRRSSGGVVAPPQSPSPSALVGDRPDCLVELRELQRLERQSQAHDQPAVPQAVGADRLVQVVGEQRALHRRVRRADAAEDLQPWRAEDVDAMHRD